MKKAWILSYPLSTQRRFWSEWADVQADLNLRWAQTHFVGFVMRQLIFHFLLWTCFDITYFRQHLDQIKIVLLRTSGVSTFTSCLGWLCWGLTSQSTIFQSCRDGAIAPWVSNQYFRGVKCLAQGHNTAVVGLEPRTSRSGVRHYVMSDPSLITEANAKNISFCIPNWNFLTPAGARKCCLTQGGVIRLSSMASGWRFQHSDIIFDGFRGKSFENVDDGRMPAYTISSPTSTWLRWVKNKNNGGY